MVRVQSHIPQQRPGRPTPSTGNETGQSISFHFVLNALRQWWKVATPVGLALAVCAAGLVYWTFTPIYSAWRTIKIQDSTPYLAFQSRDNTRRFVQTQIQTIRQPPVLQPALGKLANLPELKDVEDPIVWLQTKIGVASLGDSELYNITFQGPDRANAKKVVEAVGEAYLAQYREETDKQTQDIIALLKDEEAKKEAKVEELRNIVKELSITNVGTDPYEVKPQLGPVEDPLHATVRSQLVNAEVEKTILEARKTALENRLNELRQLKIDTTEEDADVALSREVIEQKIAKLVPEWMVEQAVALDQQVQLRQAELQAKESKLNDIERLARDGKDSDMWKSLHEEITGERSELDAFCATLAGQYREALLEQRILEEEAGLTSLELNLANQRILMETLETKRGDQEVEGQELRGITFDLEIARKNLADGEKVLDLIRDRRLRLDSEQKAADRVTPFGVASVSKVPSDPWKKILLAAMAGMLLPFGLAVLWEFFAKRVGNPQDLQRQAALPVVGEIARIPSRARAAGGFTAGAGGFALGMFEESIDSLRTNLVLSDELREMRVLAVTSAINHEGKTSVSAQLAISLARASGQKTLLIDGDMRCPDIHNVFDIPLEPGLAEVLSGECSLEDAIVTDWSDHVHLIPAGKLQMSPHKLLGNGSAKALLASVPDIYRYIVIDTPPVLAASEALVLAQAADASLICAMQDVSRIDQVKAACSRLESAGSRPVGTVLNGVPTKRYTYRYGSYAYSRQ